MAQGRVPSGLPGHPAPQNWTPDGRVTAAGYQPRAPSTAGSAPSPAAPPVAPPGRPRGDADLGGAARFRASPRGRAGSWTPAPSPATLNYWSGWRPSLIRCDWEMPLKLGLWVKNLSGGRGMLTIQISEPPRHSDALNLAWLEGLYVSKLSGVSDPGGPPVTPVLGPFFTNLCSEPILPLGQPQEPPGSQGWSGDSASRLELAPRSSRPGRGLSLPGWSAVTPWRDLDQWAL